jgi:hypothetical protein
MRSSVRSGGGSAAFILEAAPRALGGFRVMSKAGVGQEVSGWTMTVKLRRIYETPDSQEAGYQKTQRAQHMLHECFLPSPQQSTYPALYNYIRGCVECICIWDVVCSPFLVEC